MFNNWGFCKLTKNIKRRGILEIIILRWGGLKNKLVRLIEI